MTALYWPSATACWLAWPDMLTAVLPGDVRLQIFFGLVMTVAPYLRAIGRVWIATAIATGNMNWALAMRDVVTCASPGDTAVGRRRATRLETRRDAISYAFLAERQRC